MYFSNISNANNFSIYKGLLDKYLETRSQDDTRLFFEQVIRTTHDLITGVIDENKVDHKVYNLVIALADYENKWNRQYFETINPTEIGLDQLRTLSAILSSLVATNYEPA